MKSAGGVHVRAEEQAPHTTWNALRLCMEASWLTRVNLVGAVSFSGVHEVGIRTNTLVTIHRIERGHVAIS